MKSNQQAFQEIILDSITDGVFTVDKEWNITSFNRAAERITGTPKEAAVGRKCWEVFRSSICEGTCALRRTMDTGKPVVGTTVYIVNNRGMRISISISTALLKTASGKITGGVETFRDMSMIEELRKEIASKHTFSDIVTKDHAMLKLFSILPGMAKTDSTILITGESGTGKELLAKAIHDLSRRSAGPFISVNCGAFPDTLLESELFGYKKGAFTDAKKDKPGRFHLAKKGTLFLDEIGDVSPALQVKLLRVLQEREFEPLGAVASEKADVRVIAATNKDMGRLVKEGIFRMDLYYRINVLTVTLPPLRERSGDIPLLARHFIGHYSIIHQKEIIDLTDDAMAVLMRHDFPGNIRELQNIIEYAFIMCASGSIGTEHLPEHLLKSGKQKSAGGAGPRSMKNFEREYILSALQANRYNRQKTARGLGMHKTTLWRKMRRLGI